MKVLFCTDGSNISYYAIKNFLNWFNNLSVDILCVADWNFLPDGIVVEDGSFALKCANSADEIIEYSYIYLSKLGLNAEKKIKMCGSVVDVISEVISNNDYDAVVLGSNGKKGLQKWLGSVSQEIASSSNIPVFIAKGENSSKRILFSVDTSENAIKILDDYLINLNLSDKEIYITTVYESPDYLFLKGNIDSNWINDINKKQEISSGLLLNKYKDIFEKYQLKIHDAAILNGNPASEIIKYSYTQGIDLTVCVVRNRNALSKILVNSVSRRILENSKSDVLLIKTNNQL